MLKGTGGVEISPSLQLTDNRGERASGGVRKNVDSLDPYLNPGSVLPWASCLPSLGLDFHHLLNGDNDNSYLMNWL